MIVEDKSYRALMQVSNTNIIISVGFGVLAEPTVSIRLAAYLLPAIELYNSLTRQGNIVTIRIYFAEQAAPITLGKNYNASLVQAWIKQAQAYLQKFIETFHEGLDVKFYKDSPWEGSLGLVLHSLSQRKWPARIQNQLSRFPNPRLSLKYWVAHALYMLTPLDINWCPILEGEAEPPYGSVVAIINGPQESGPRELISFLRSQIGTHNRWMSLHISTPIGRLPVYSKTEPDIFVSDLPNLDPYVVCSDRTNYKKDAFADLGTLLAYSCGMNYEQRNTEEAWLFGLEELQSRI